MDISNFYLACVWAILEFMPMLVVGPLTLPIQLVQNSSKKDAIRRL